MLTWFNVTIINGRPFTCAAATYSSPAEALAAMAGQSGTVMVTNGRVCQPLTDVTAGCQSRDYFPPIMDTTSGLGRHRRRTWRDDHPDEIWRTANPFDRRDPINPFAAYSRMLRETGQA